MSKHPPTVCRNCGNTGHGNFCAWCAEKYAAEKITLASLIHQVIHFFTHVDKGFGYTVKQLIKSPGEMQRKYMEGFRSKHQKPFQFFFVCGTISGLGYYFIIVAKSKLFGSTDAVEEDFFRHYFVLLQALMLPLYALVSWLIFIRSKYNYAEMLVLILYNIGFVFLILIPINLLNLVFTHLDTRYIEVIFLLFYNTITNLRFFINSPRWVVILKTILVLAIIYSASQVVAEVVKGFLK